MMSVLKKAIPLTGGVYLIVIAISLALPPLSRMLQGWVS